VDTTGAEERGEEDRDNEEGAEEEQLIWLEKQEKPTVKGFSMQREPTV